MKFINKHSLQAAILAFSLVTSLATARAGHVYAGIIDTDGISGLGAGDALAFVSTSTGLAITGASLGTQTMSLVSVGSQTGYYMTSNISFTGLSDGLNWTGSAYRAASPYAALSSSYIVMQIASITGPDGAQFSFWDESISTTAPASTYTVGGGLIGLPYINLTDPSLLVSDGQGGYVAQGTSGVDPYGHIHGRSFTVNTPGTYTVSYILRDLNGQQADSAPFVVTYGAVPEPASVAMIVGAVALLSVIALRRRRVTNI